MVALPFPAVRSSIHSLRSATLFAAAALAAGACPSAAFAGLAGSFARADYYAYGELYQGNFASGTVEAFGSTLGTFGAGFAFAFSIRANDSQVIIDFSQAQASDTWSGSVPSLNSNGLYVDNGFAMTFIGAPEITGVSVNAASNMPGFTSSNLTFNSGAIAIAWAGLPFSPSTVVVLDVATVPAPGAIALLSIAGAAGQRRRRR